MSNTSDQTTKPSKETRLIVGEVGVDTETGIVGKGHSYDSGKTFIVDDTIYGRVYHADDHGKIWKGIQDQVAKVVAPAKSAADSAASAADAAVASAQVTSDAVSAIASATAEAKQGASEALDHALSAWDVAIGAKSAVTDFDPLLKRAQSDAGKALSQIADTASALSDAKTAFDSDVAAAKELASTAQTTADSAVKSASSVADDLAAVANQAKANANGITKVTSDVGLLQTTVANNSGNISTIQETAKQIQQAVSDNAGNITVAKQTADSAVTVASDARSSATVAIQTASQASVTAQNASGQAASAVITANGAMTTASNAKSDATVAVQTASGASLTATNANNDATVAKQTASEAKVQASNAESDFAQISIRANKIEANVANNSGAIASVQQTANGLTSRVGNLESKTNTQETAIEQNKNAITLKADQTTVDKINGTVSQLQSSLTVQAGQIQEKVTSSQVTGMLAGYATQDYTQSLVTQTANNWNLNLTSLQTDVNAIKTTGGGRNLIANTGTDIVIDATSDVTNNWSFAVLGFIEQPKQGDLITVSAEGTLTGTGTLDEYQVVLYNASTANSRSQAQYLKAGKRDSVTLSLDNLDGDGDTVLLIYAGKASETGGKKNVVHHLMVEKGTVAHDWQPAPSDMATVTSMTNLSATVDGIQAQVYNSDGSSKITQLSNLIATKVSQGDYNSQITQLKNDINLRVSKGDVISQINQEAGGNTLIQVSNGKGSLILNADNTIITGKAWIPSAAIANLTADQVQAGTLKGVKVDFRDSTGTGMIADGSTLTFDVSNTPAAYLSYNGMPVAELPDGSGGNELAIRYRLSTAIIPDDSSDAQATFSKAAQKIAYMTGTSQGKRMLSGLEVHANNHHWLCAVNSDATCNRFEVNDRDGLNIAWHDNTHFWISDGKAKLYKDYDDGQTATKLEVHGWAWVNGWVEAAGHSQHSALSTKTALQSIDDDEMLEMVNNTDLASFLFKTDVASGETHRHIGLIIDDVHDVAQYQAPQDFIAPNGVSRDDDNMIGALFGAVKALTKRIKTLESKVG